MAVSAASCLCCRASIAVLGAELKLLAVMDTDSKSNSGLQASKHPPKKWGDRNGTGTETFTGCLLAQLKPVSVHTAHTH